MLNGKPCGWGVLYDKNNERVYEGFRIGESNVCYGRIYYSDIPRLEYEGEWCDGMRWGRGVQLDRNGVVVYDGEWLNDDPLNRRIEITSATVLLPSQSLQSSTPSAKAVSLPQSHTARGYAE